MPHLWYRDLQDEARTLVLSGNRLRIGRSDACWLVLDSDRVSRVHAELVKDKAGQWTVADHGSANGSKVNGEAISKHTLSAGDVINIGGFDLHFIDDAAAHAYPRPAFLKQGGNLRIAYIVGLLQFLD